MGNRQRAGRRVGDRHPSRGIETWEEGGSARVTPVQAGKEGRNGDAGNGAPKKEVRNWRRKSLLEGEGPRGGERGVFALWMGKGRSLPPARAGAADAWGSGARADAGGGAVLGVPGAGRGAPQRRRPYLNLSCPAVSQSCSLILLPGSISSRREKKSTPTVGSQAGECRRGKRPRVKRCRRHDLPTVESPITMRRNW